MNAKLKGILMVSSLLLAGGLAEAGVSAGVEYNSGRPWRHARRSYPYRTYYSAYHGYYPWAYRPVRPVVVRSPIIVGEPYVLERTVSPIYINNPDGMEHNTRMRYQEMLGELHSRMYDYRSLLDRQVEKGGISQIQYERHVQTLNGIGNDERGKTTANNGRLSTAQIEDLDRQVDNLERQIRKDLIQ